MKRNIVNRAGSEPMRRARGFWAFLLATALAIAAVGLSACGGSEEASSEAQATATMQAAAMDQKDLVETAVAAGTFKTLASLLDEAGLVGTLQGEGPYTVFAPTDAAFAKVPAETLEALAADPAALKEVLLHHVVAGRVPANEAAKLGSTKTLNGEVAISVSDGSVYVDDAKVTTPDVMASNGIIHVIDSVLIPKNDLAAPKNIVETAVAAGTFKTLASLLERAGLADTLQGEGPFTVFAPTDAAFAKVSKATLAALAKDKAKLRMVLLYHVVKGELTAAEVAELRSAKTLNGQSVTIRVRGGKVRVGGARVTSADVAASNGVVHVINKVLIPR